MGYFIQSGEGSPRGPYSAEDIVDSITSQRLAANASVRDELRGNWMEASAHREISDLLFARSMQRQGVELVDDLTLPTVDGPSLGRLGYFLSNLGLSLGVSVLIALCAAVVAPPDNDFLGHYRAMEFRDDVRLATIFVGILLIPARLWFAAMRFRDLGREGSECFKILIPFYNLYVAFVLLFTPGHAASKG